MKSFPTPLFSSYKFNQFCYDILFPHTEMILKEFESVNLANCPGSFEIDSFDQLVEKE